LTMNADDKTNQLIAQLAAELRPVRPVRAIEGMAAVALIALMTLTAVAVFLGFRAELLSGEVTPLFVLANGLFLLLGAAAATAVVLMANPQVGNRAEGWRWALAAICLLPVAAVASADLQDPRSQLLAVGDLSCILYGSALGLLTGAVLTLWLRRGAPAQAGRAGFLTGLASGAIGVFAYGFHCQLDGIDHLGLAHVVPLVLCSFAGWAIVPRLVRW
jgi:hypothetical protein